MTSNETVRKYYNETVSEEWSRIDGRPEFLLTCRFLNRYIKSGDRVLDIGGGPGRYSLYLAEKGCDVTLLDLAEENVAFASAQAQQRKLPLNAVCGDARFADSKVDGLFDTVLLMGPLYHLVSESDRILAVNAALKLLKPGGTLFASFISVYGGMVYMTKLAPETVISDNPMEKSFRKCLEEGVDYAGAAFTDAFFIQPRNVLPFMAQFPVEKLHLFGQEGIMSPNEEKIYAAGREVIDGMVDFSEKLCENIDVLPWSEHLMYVGRKAGGVQ